MFFQDKPLDQKVARLTNELTEESEPFRTEDISGDIRPFHVWKVIDLALRRILFLKQHARLPLANGDPLPNPAIPPTQTLF